ncbi:MAG: hypothetical protein C5B49_11005 [Bdellovibrio sp.]|nr:MAG: hypothetical protein C5B49_11005 [Bdellovibrio sp.]
MIEYGIGETGGTREGHMARILVIDDSADFRELLRVALQNEGFDVTTAANGQEALLALESEKNRPDLILLDQNMPGMEGSEFSRRLRKMEKFRFTPIILVSGTPVEPCDPFCATLGKPFRSKTLFDLIRRFLERREEGPDHHL